MIKWGRFLDGYEVSSKGDKRFSAFNAIMKDGRSIEMHYQCDVKGYDINGTNWRLGKGKPPKDKNVDLWKKYLDLWKIWSNDNKELISILYKEVINKNYILTDQFATSPINQARALSTILNEIYFNKK